MWHQGDNSSGPTVSNATCQIHDSFLSPALPVLYSVICLAGVLTNAMTVAVLFLKIHSDSSMAVYMRHLAVSDFLLALSLAVRVHYHNSQGPFYLCKAVGVFFYINMYASILFLSLISLDRYLKVIKPLWVVRIHRVSWSRRASCAVWAGLVLAMSLFFLSNNRDHPCDRICFHFHNKGVPGAAMNMAAIACFFALFLLFLCFYGRITSRLSTLSLGKKDPGARRRRKRRLLLKTLAVPAMFTLCFLPYHCVRVPYVLAQVGVIGGASGKQTLHVMNEATLLLSALNCCLDPVIYYLLSSTYRKTIVCALQGKVRNLYDVQRRRISLNCSFTDIEREDSRRRLSKDVIRVL